ncbi:Sodium/hydrogen exchanger family-domain-containing protein [Phycomyces blakesleeanus]|uniref:Sodium/hydrogen exchanger family-domain-containing protein n=1 Tax=Phycomyces blakesleeanus TaxID=4837 RepID=A0ABR3BG28_PHYBL
MAVGIELPKHYMKKDWKTMIILLLPVMIVMWMVSGLIIWWMVPTINYIEALVISACICPTDPILANSVVKGRFAEKHVPSHIRNALSAESGANDGMGFPFLFLAIFIIGEDDVGQAVGKWIYETCLFQIALSCVIGVIVGWAARKALQWSERNHLIDKPSFLSFAIALALFLMSMTGFSGSDDVLACFVAGNAFSWDDWFRQETEEAHFQDVIDMMLNLAIFVYIGAIIPWSDFGNAELGLSAWRLVAMAILILLFRRLPIVVLLKPVMPAMKTYQEAVFTGWFGPMGVGAVFLSKIAKEELMKVYTNQEEPISVKVINPIVLFIVLSSVVVHGTTIPLFKLGKSIQTRTLSISSITSSSHPGNLRRSEEGRRGRLSRDIDGPMTELQRNTLFNTIQHDCRNKEDGVMAIVSLSDHNTGPGFLINMHENRPNAPFGKEDDAKSYNGLDIDHEPQVADSIIPHSGLYLQHPGSSATLGSQTIRFLEPVNPRIVTPVIEKADINLKKPRSTFKPKEKKELLDIPNDTQHTSIYGLFSIFRKNKVPNEESARLEDGDEKIINLEATPVANCDPLPGADNPEILYTHPQLEIWEQRNHIVEVNDDSSSTAVIDKDDPDWIHKTIETIETIEHAILSQPLDKPSFP